MNSRSIDMGRSGDDDDAIKLFLEELRDKHRLSVPAGRRTYANASSTTSLDSLQDSDEMPRELSRTRTSISKEPRRLFRPSWVAPAPLESGRASDESGIDLEDPASMEIIQPARDHTGQPRRVSLAPGVDSPRGSVAATMSLAATMSGRPSASSCQSASMQGFDRHRRRKAGSRWSLGHLTYIQKQFENVRIEEMYQRYRLRLQRRLLIRLLILLSLYHIVVFILHNTISSDTEEALLILNISILTTILIPIILIIPVICDSIYYRPHAALFISLAVWVYLNILLFFHLPISIRTLPTTERSLTPSVNVPLVFFCMFATHTMLPLSRKLSTVLATLTGAIDLTLMGIFSNVSSEVLLQEICANCVIYICTTLTGFHHKHLTDIANRHTFLETRKFIETDMKYSGQREVQIIIKEGLLLKIIPRHHLADMKRLLNRKVNEIMDRGIYQRRSFHELMVERHDNVSILYADIVNFTPLTSSMEPPRLVYTLNELFGGFDELAERNRCMRIKMLGDCYYCVCGLPEPSDVHARSCIIMGVQMIKLIRSLRKKLKGVEGLDMRIGVHSGYVLSGILGIKKWQYDIWSDDVTIANHMESSGQPGKVHITDVTLKELKGEFEVEEASASQIDTYLNQASISHTYFIAESEYDKICFHSDDCDIENKTPVTAQLGANADDVISEDCDVTSECGGVINGELDEDQQQLEDQLQKHIQQQRQQQQQQTLHGAQQGKPTKWDINKQLEKENDQFKIENEIEEPTVKNHQQQKQIKVERQQQQQQHDWQDHEQQQQQKVKEHSEEDKEQEQHEKQRQHHKHKEGHCSGSYSELKTTERPFDGLKEYQKQRLKCTPDQGEVNRRLERAFFLEDSASSLSDERKERVHSQRHEMNMISLRFKTDWLERQYMMSRDVYYKLYVFWSFLIYIFLVVVQLILLDRRVNISLSLIVGVAFFSILIILTSGIRCRIFQSKSSDHKLTLMLQNAQKKLNDLSDFLVSHFVSKICICFLTVTFVFVASAVPVINCHSDCWYELDSSNISVEAIKRDYRQSLQSTNQESNSSILESQPCLIAPYYTYSCMITLIACSMFLRVTHIAKTFFMLFCLAVFNIIFYLVFDDVFAFYDKFFNVHHLSSTVRSTLHTSILFTALFMLDRQVEKNLRLDFLCKQGAREDKEEVERNEFINELLLVNLLPVHVAEHFINKSPTDTELYHIICPKACIMFAAIPNFKVFFSEVDVSGKECLRLLNEIISVFDKLLMTNPFKGVEKMKTIGSTYMAATGLEPKPVTPKSVFTDSSKALAVEENSPDDNADDNNDCEGAENLVLIVRFAFMMMTKLAELSKDAFYEYKLRIGINQGKIIAGVVGAAKPQFDIWGDAVNVASRMESHGLMGHIQVPETTAITLQRHGYQCDYRGEIFVKGKGNMRVCLVSDQLSNDNYNQEKGLLASRQSVKEISK